MLTVDKFKQMLAPDESGTFVAVKVVKIEGDSVVLDVAHIHGTEQMVRKVGEDLYVADKWKTGKQERLP